MATMDHNDISSVAANSGRPTDRNLDGREARFDALGEARQNGKTVAMSMNIR